MDFSRVGRVNAMLARRLELLAEVHLRSVHTYTASAEVFHQPYLWFVDLCKKTNVPGRQMVSLHTVAHARSIECPLPSVITVD